MSLEIVVFAEDKGVRHHGKKNDDEGKRQEGPDLMLYEPKSSYSQVYLSQELVYTFFIDYLGCQDSSILSSQIADTKWSSLQATVPVNCDREGRGKRRVRTLGVGQAVWQCTRKGGLPCSASGSVSANVEKPKAVEAQEDVAEDEAKAETQKDTASQKISNYNIPKSCKFLSIWQGDLAL
jgi:hypothetical protein